MEIDKWLNIQNYKELNKELIIRITPLSPFSLCRNKGNCYAFNITPTKQVLCGLFQNFLNIRYNKSDLPKEFQKVSYYQNNNNLSFCPIVHNHFIVEGIKYPKIDATYINYEGTLSYSTDVKKFIGFYKAPTRREYAITSDSYILKLKCSEFFYNEMLREDNAYSNIFLGNKQSFCSLQIITNISNIALQPYNEDITYDTFEKCVSNFETMNLWSKYGFTYLLNKLFPNYLEDPTVIHGIKIDDKIDEIKKIFFEEKQYTSFVEANYDEINNLQYFHLKPYEAEDDVLNTHISLIYKDSKGDSTKVFKDNVLKQITLNNNEGFNFLRGLGDNGSILKSCMWINPYYLSTDRIVNNKSNCYIQKEIIIFSIIATLTYDKFFKFDDRTIYSFIPELDFINLMKYHRYITSNLKKHVGDFLKNKKSDTKQKTYPKMFFTNINDFINLKTESNKVKDILMLININYYIATILNESHFSFDKDFIETLSKTYWNIISPQKKIKYSLNEIIQEIILKNYSQGNKCLEDFKIKYDSSNILKYNFAELLYNSTLYNLYKFLLTYNKQNKNLMKYNILIEKIIKENKMDDIIKKNSVLLGNNLNKKAYIIAKNKNVPNIKEEKVKYIKNIANIINNGKSLSDIIYLVNKYLLRFNIVNNFFQDLDEEFLLKEYNEKDFSTIKKLIYISLTSEKIKTNEKLDDAQEIETEETINLDNIFN